MIENKLFCHCCEQTNILLGKYRVITRFYEINKSYESEEVSSNLFCDNCIKEIKNKSKNKEIHCVKARIGYKGYIFIKDIDPNYYRNLNLYSPSDDKTEEDIICEDLDFLF